MEGTGGLMACLRLASAEIRSRTVPLCLWVTLLMMELLPQETLFPKHFRATPAAGLGQLSLPPSPVGEAGVPSVRLRWSGGFATAS